MSHSSRRDFLKGAVLAGAGLSLADYAWAKDKKSFSANETINFACIGVGGKGDSDTADASRSGNIVAICDVDENTLRKASQKYPNAKTYTDYRKLLEEMEDSIDAVTVSTPDHTHFLAAALAVDSGKHTFCQKPLTHSIWEARELGKLAKKRKVATQMGNQGTANDALRKAAALIKQGVVGNVSEVHVWTNRPIWDQGGGRPSEAPVPEGLHWDTWLGPAPVRPYGKGYHTFGWRGWWDFGTGALGDMACHTFNMPFMALDLRNPTSVVAESGGHNGDSYPKWSIIRFQFPENDGRPAIPVTWYDGGKKPPAELIDRKSVSDSGCIIIGEKGKFYAPGDYAEKVELIGTDAIEVTYPKSPGHFQEFIRAIRTGEPAMSNFPDYAGPLTETILLGNLAVWANGKQIEWDAKRLKARNAPEVMHVVKSEPREGWKFD